MDKAAQPLVGVAGIHQQHVCPLLVILPYHVVGKEGLAVCETEYGIPPPTEVIEV